MKTRRLSNEDERWSRVRKMKKKSKIRGRLEFETDWLEKTSFKWKKKHNWRRKWLTVWRKSLQKLLSRTIFSLPGFTGTSFPALSAGCTDFLCTMIGSSNSSWQSIEAGQRNTIFAPFYFSSPVPYTGAQWCYEANPNPNPNPTMEELIHSEIFSPFLRSFTKGNSIPSWQCFIRAAFNAYNIMKNRKLTVTKSNFFRQKVFAVITGDLVIQHQRNILSLLWYEGNTENDGVIVVCSSWRQNLEIG